MKKKKYIIYTDNVCSQHDMKMIADAFNRFITAEDASLLILPSSMHLVSVPKTPEDMRHKRKNRNI